jgi:isocitrate dehydrogenase
MAASARSTGWRSTPARRRPRSTARTSGCPKRRCDVKDYVVSIKGPLTTPVGGGIRSLNVALRQQLDLYVCLRPVRYFKGVPSPVKAPEKVDMVIFRENSEDIYAGIEYEAESDKAKKLIKFLQDEWASRRSASRHLGHRHQAGLARRHRAPGAQGDPVRDRQRQALGHDRAQGQHHEVHRRWLPRLGLRAGAEGIRRELIDGGPWCKFKNPKTGKDITVKDSIADAFLQQILLRPAEYSSSPR